MFQALRKFLENEPGATMIGHGRTVRHADAEALNWLIQTAEQGDAKAQNNLGFMYDVGLGVRQDDAEAMRWYSKAAAQGDTKALHNLGLMAEIGHGVRPDEAKAPGWFRTEGALSH